MTWRGAIFGALCGVMLVGHHVPATAADDPAPATSSILTDLGFTLTQLGPDKNSISFTKTGLVVPTPWGDFEATVISTSIDRMVRVPLAPNPTDSSQPRLLPYVTAGSRNGDEDSVLESARRVAYGSEAAKAANLKAGAGVLLKLDENVELFGEYQFMRLQRESGSGAGPLGTGLDRTGFSLGLSVRY